MSATGPIPPQPLGPSGWERFSRAAASGFQRYAKWLVTISWKKFFLLSILLLVCAGILGDSVRYTSNVYEAAPAKKTSAAKLKKLKEKYRDVDVRIDENGVHITRKRD
ncbi:MAG: hypothetical protein ACREVG_11590, partial [Burkholderiales bacterium]